MPVTHRFISLTVALALLGGLCLVAAHGAGGLAAASVPARASLVDEQVLISRSNSAGGGFANAASSNPVISFDTRQNTIVAFDSFATDLVSGDGNGRRDVFFARRQSIGTSQQAPAWRLASIRLASRTPGDNFSNGDSYGPDVDGSAEAKPSCIAFVSKASNLVKGDTNKVADAFVYRLGNDTVARVSKSTSGKQANGATHDVAVNGDCSKVAFTSTANNLALTNTSVNLRKRYVTRNQNGKRRQVYVRVLKAEGGAKPLKGMTFLASRSNGGSPGNGDSYDVALGLSISESAVAFTSTSTNLASNDKGKTADVYLRKIPIPTRSGHSTKLVSANSRGTRGNRPSGHAAIDSRGTTVAFDTRASNLLPNDSNGVSDVARFQFENGNRDCKPGRNFISRGPNAIGDGPSLHPTMTLDGCYVAFDTEATNLNTVPQQDRDSRLDAVLWTVKRGNSNKVLLSTGQPGRGASTLPVISSYGNYAVYRSEVSPSGQTPAQIYLAYIDKR